MERTCDFCGAFFESTKKKYKRFCSKGCHDKHWSRKQYPIVDYPEQPCSYCGTLFKPKNTLHRYCSGKCRWSVNNDKQKTEQEKVCVVCEVRFKTTDHKRKYCWNCGQYRSRGKNRVSRALGAEILRNQDNKCWLCKGTLTFEVAKIHHLDGDGQKDGANNSKDNLVGLHDSCHKLFHYIFLVQIEGRWYIKGDIFRMLNIKELKVEGN